MADKTITGMTAELIAADTPAISDPAVPAARRGFPWHVIVFLAPAVIIYTAVMIVPLAETLRLSFFNRDVGGGEIFVGLQNFIQLFSDERWSVQFWNALWNNFYFFLIHMLVQNPIGVALAALLSMAHLPGRTFYRTAIFIPTMLSVVIIGFAWKLILSPIWGVSSTLLGAVGLKWLYAPWLGKEEYALTALSLISVWQYVGIPMMLIYAALLNIPDEVIEAADLDGVRGPALFFKVKLPLILPSIGIISILTFIGNFNAFDLIYATQGALAGPNFATDILGTYLYRVFFGFQLQAGDPHMGATVAAVMFLIILTGVMIYLLGVQRRMTRYQF
jgi:raffinose/stachyose/melibiose transport system permease protein